jgi:hypothetical protein
MTSPLMAEMLLAERTRELRAEAATARLAALVRCCRPSAWTRAARRAAAAVRAVPRAWRADGATTSCCAPA